MKKSILALMIILTCISNNLFCQELEDDFSVHNYNRESDYIRCGFGCESDTWLYKYRTPGYWIPNDSTPIKTILVNWVICRDDDGQNGWHDTPLFRSQVDSVFVRLNEYFSNSLPKGYSLTCEPQYTHIYDSKIRFELNEIIFIDNTVFNLCGYGDWQARDAILAYLFSNYPSSKKALNHIFTNPDYNGDTWGVTYPGGGHTFVFSVKSMNHPGGVNGNDHLSHISHEYGHNVGQLHVYYDEGGGNEFTCIDYFDFLDDVFGTCAENVGNCTHNSFYSCDGEQVCFLPKNWFTQQPHPLMSGKMNATNRYISPKGMGRMHRNLSLFDESFGAPSYDTHKFVKEKHSYSIPKVINSDETWDFKIKMYQDIIVDNNATLTITGEVRMPIDGKIIVKPGAKLIVDGGTLTTAHDSLWYGIQVWGNSNASQSPHQGIYSQGYVELKNGATIKNAVCALELGKPYDQTKCGGIAVATDANFINNAQSVRASHYIYTINGNEANNLSSFTRCNFEVNDDYFGTETFYKHVGLNTVKGVEFRGCSFSVDRTASNIATYCLGIGAEDASFTATSHCDVPNSSPCPNGSLSVGTFTGFYNAIYAIYTYTQRPFYVLDCEFNDNINGIYAINTGFAQILGNTFYVPSESICTFGVYLERLTSFVVGSNEFIGIGSGSENCGVGVKISPYDNIIEQNSFTNLAFGTESIGKNYNVIPVRPTRYVTLNYLCNNNSSNVLADFYAINDESNFGGVYDQGSSSKSAGNTFSSNNTQHIANLTTHSFTYYYDTIYSGRKPTLTYGVTTTKTNNANDCGMGGGGGSNNKSPLTDYEEAENNCNRIIASLEAENDPNNIEVLEAELAQAEHQRLTIVGNAVRNILMDSISDINEARLWLGRANTPDADRAICATYLSQGDYETALDKATAMIEKYEMEYDALIEQTEYISILKLQRKVEGEGRVMEQLNSEELGQVQRLAENGTGVARSMAKALLQMNGYFFECDCNNEIQTRESEGTKADAVNKPSEKEEYYFAISPVPAKDYIIVSYILPTDHATLTITNNLGMTIKTVSIEGRQGKKVVSLSDVISGVYFCTLQGEEYIRTNKLIVTKQ